MRDFFRAPLASSFKYAAQTQPRASKHNCFVTSQRQYDQYETITATDRPDVAYRVTKGMEVGVYLHLWVCGLGLGL